MNQGITAILKRKWEKKGQRKKFGNMDEIEPQININNE
jgi:hypothetical protein